MRALQLGVLGGRLALLAIVALRIVLRLICVCGFVELFMGLFYSESESIAKRLRSVARATIVDAVRWRL